MHRTFSRLIVGLLLCLLVVLNHAHAASFPEIIKGLGWLAGQPRGDGTLVSEQLSVGALVQARAESFRLLQQQSASALPATAVDALLASTEDNTEFVARKAIVAGITKRPSAALALSLAQRQNADGGVGPALGYQSSIVDTAWTLLAWHAVNYSDTGVISRALDYVASHSNGDGGFGPNSTSSTFHTSYGLMALQVHSLFLGTSPAIVPARSWLVNHRAQGSYGNVVDNAVAVLALTAISTDASIFAGAVSALRLSQSADGSWGGDPYATALALSALVAADGTATPDGAGALSGQVIDADTGAAISGAQIVAAGPQSATIRSGPSGSFLLQGLSPGDYTLSIGKESYASASAQARISTGATTSVGVIALRSNASTATLKGQIRDGRTGAPLSGATIALSTGPSTPTDSTGNYQLNGLTPGAFIVVASKTGYASVTGAGTFSAGSTVVFSPSLYPNGETPQDVSAHGTVIDAKTRAPIAAATVRIGTLSATTDPTGQFTVAGLIEGAATLQVSAASYKSASFALTLAKGVNELSAIELSARPANITVSGRITDKATNLPLGGATVIVIGTALRAASDPAGLYQIVGVDVPEFSVSVSAAGYLRKTLNVSLPSFDDTTLDVALESTQSLSGISIKRVSTDKPSYAPFSSIEIEVDVVSTRTTPASLRFAATILDAQGVPAIELPARLTTDIAANSETEIELESFITNQPAGLYTLEVHAYDIDGVLQAEGAASFTIEAARRISGGITLDPPITQAGTNQPVNMRASLFNQGNLDVGAGTAQLTVTIVQPDTSTPQTSQLVVQPLLSGPPLKNIGGMVYDAQGIAYAINAGDRKIIRIAPDGSSSIVVTLPQSFTSPALSVVPVDLAMDRQGIFYVLNQSSEIFKVTPAGAITRIRTNLSAQRGIDVAPDGSLYVTDATAGSYALYKVSQAGVLTTLAQAGLSAPRGIATGIDGSLYVSNFGNSTIAKVSPDGRVMPFVTSGLSQPQGIVSDSAGNLYVANSGAANVVKITAAGAVSVFATGFDSPYGVAFDGAGNLLVTDRNANAVMRVPASGGVAQPFARALVSSPQGLRYDSQGNLIIAGSDQVVRLDTNDKLTVLSTSLSGATGVALDTSNNAYVVRQAAGQISRITPAGAVSTVATGLNTPYGVAVDEAGTLYVTEQGTARIVTINAAGQRQTLMEALISNPACIDVDAAGQIYALNATSLVQLQGNGQFAFWSRNLNSPVSFVRAADGFIYLQEVAGVKRLDAAGNVTVIRSNLGSLASGIVADASGNLYIAEQSSRQIQRLDSAGNITVVATLPAAPFSFIGDGSGGFYVMTANNTIVRVDASGAVSGTIAAIGGASRLAFDAAGGRLLVLTSGGVLAVNLATKAITTFVSQSGLAAIKTMPDGSVLLVNGVTRELLTYSAAGTLQSSVAGFGALKDIVWTGSSLIFADSTRLYTLAPNQYPRILATASTNFLDWRNNTLYLSTFSNVSVLSSSNAVLPLFSLSGFTGLSGIAVRSDGTFSVASSTDSRVQTISAAGQVLASYANILTPKGIAVAADGSVFVASGTNQILKLDASGKRGSLFATTPSVDGIALDAAGQLFAISGRQILRYDAAANAMVLGTSTGLSGLSGIAVQGDTPILTDPAFSVLRRVKGTDLTAYAAGLTNPRRVKVGPDGAVYVANRDSDAITRVTSGGTEVYASDVSRANALSFGPSGQLYVGGLNGQFFAVQVDRTVTSFSTLSTLLSGGSIDYVAVDPAGIPLAARADQNDLLKIHVVAPSAPPSPGTVVFSASAAMPALSVGGATTIDFGNWVPPFGGDYKLMVSAGGVDGQAVNTLHVGAGASGQLFASRATVPPGDSLVHITANLKGADFTTIAKADTASLALVASNVGTTTKAMGADAAGNIYYTNDRQLLRVTPQGQTSVIYTANTTIFLRGAIPVDDQQNVYVTTQSNTQIVRIAPDGTSAILASLPANIVSLMRNSRDEIIAVTAFSVYRIKHDGTVFEIGAGGLLTPAAATIDGRDNIYIHSSSNLINKIAPDGTASVFLSDPKVTFEYEGVNIAGDCADNLFVTPFVWPAVGINGGREEQVLVQIVGSTGKAAQILDGTKLNDDLTDMDMIVYDRFSSNLLIWTDNSQGRVYRVPITCGAIDTDLHLVLAAVQSASGFSVAPSATLQRADGSTERVWSFKDVAAAGKSMQFDTLLSGLHLGDQRAVAVEAFLVFKNSFVAGDVKIPLNIPIVGVDGQVDLTVTTDKPSYGANQQVMSDLVLSNRDSTQRVGKLLADIVDERGSSVAHLLDQIVSLDAGSSAALLSPFNTGSRAPGRYTVKGSLVDAASGLELVRATASFLINGADASDAQVSARIVADKAAYRPSETIRLHDRITNLTASDTLAGLSVLTRVTNPDGSMRFEKTEALPELAQSAVKDYQYGVALGFAPAGTYRATLSIVGISGGELAFASTNFEVLSTETTGSGLEGTLTAVPKQVVLGDTAAFNVTAANQGNAALHALPLKVRIVEPATQQIVSEFAYVAELPIGGTFQAATSWTATGRAGTTYVVALLATVGQNALLLAQDTVTVTSRPVSIDVDHSNPRQARVLALVSCEPGASGHDDDDDEDCDSRSKKEDESCAGTRAQALRDYLTALGVDNLVTTDVKEFTHHFRCGRYNTYWVSGGAYKLSEDLAKELREAVYRGDSLVLEGAHDERNALLDEAAGVKFRGHLPGKDFKVALGNTLFTAGEVATNGIALKYQALGATVQAQLENTNKDPALLSNLYGNGRAVVAAFELAETIRHQPSMQAWRDVGAVILGFVASPPPSSLVEGAFVPVQTTIANKGQAAEIEVQTALPPGALVFSSAPPASVSTTLASWRSNIGAGQTQQFELGVRLPFSVASAALPVTVNLVKSGGATETIATFPMQLELRALTQLFADARDALAHVVPVPKSELEKALHSRKEIDDAQEALDKNDPDHAIEELIESLDDLRSVKSVSTSVARLAIDRLLQEVELRWCDAQCNPPAPRVHDGNGFTAYGVNERFEARGGKSGTSDWEWALGFNTLAASQSAQQSADWVSGKTYKWTLTYDGKGNGSYSVYDGSKLLFKRDYNGAGGTLHAGNALKFQAQSAEGLGSAKISATATTLNGKAIDVNLSTAGNDKSSSATVYYFYPAMTNGFTVNGTVKLTFSGSVPAGSKIGFTVTSGNVSCK